jgi:hypothetical protein
MSLVENRNIVLIWIKKTFKLMRHRELYRGNILITQHFELVDIDVKLQKEWIK